MAKIVKLNVMISASTKGLSAGITKAQGMLNTLERRTRKMRTSLGSAFTDMGRMATRGFTALGVAAVGAAAGLAYLTKNSIDAIGDTNDFAKSLGLTYNQLKAFQFAAQQAGVDSGALDAAFGKMADTLGTAFGGDKGAIKAFEQIGLSVDDLKKMNPAQQFEAIANAINKIQDPSVKMAAARDVFGKSGGRLIALFENAGQAIKNAGATLGFFGINLGQLDVSKVDAAGDAMGTLGLMLEGIGNQLARVVSPWITQVTNDTIAWIEEMGGIGPAVEAGVNVALSKLDEFINKISAAQEAYNNIASYVTGGVGYVADKAADIADATGISGAFKANQSEQRILHGIAPEKQAEARRLLRERGGFEQEGITARRISNAMNSRSREYAGEAKNIAARTSFGDRFANWRANAEGGGIMQQAPAQTRTREREDPALQVLRNIEANTGKNKIAFAGPN